MAYALAFARSGSKVSMDEPIKNDQTVTAFSVEKLEDPWEKPLPENYTQDLPRIKPCKEVSIPIISHSG